MAWQAQGDDISPNRRQIGVNLLGRYRGTIGGCVKAFEVTAKFWP